MSKYFRSVILFIVIIFGGVVIGMVIENKSQVWQDFSVSKDVIPLSDSSSERWSPDFKLVRIPSPADKKYQKAFYYKSTDPQPRPLVVNLHSWTWDYRQFDTLATLSKAKNINYIHPDFRGPNRTPDACCSDLVLTDIDAAIEFAISKGGVDTTAIYVIGRSGGGYATLATFMKSKHNIKKFSAWVPLTDLVAWYEETRIRKLYYANDILICTHSPDSVLNIEMAKQKSPYYWNTPAEKLNASKLDIYAGVYDGLENNGPIPITHSIRFYNKVLKDLGVKDTAQYVSDAEILQLLETRKPLADLGKIGDRTICLRKEYKSISLTIFTGGHEILPGYAFDELFK